MVFWRISAFPDLSGRGGMLASGRWHRAGCPVVYLADTPAGAMLEVLVHLEIDPDDFPDNLRLIRVELPDDVAKRSVSDLPDLWEDQKLLTQAIGDAWLQANESLLLTVPSAVMPHTNNFLFNPMHPDAAKANVIVETLRLDRRLLGARF